jgi:hypothetical protein
MKLVGASHDGGSNSRLSISINTCDNKIKTQTHQQQFTNKKESTLTTATAGSSSKHL